MNFTKSPQLSTKEVISNNEINGLLNTKDVRWRIINRISLIYSNPLEERITTGEMT